MDLETAQRIERLEYLVEMLCRHQGLDAGQLPGRDSALPPVVGDRPPAGDAVPPGYGPPITAPAGAHAGPQLPPIFYEYVRTGKKIQAIKVFREVTGAGLEESKDFVDRISRR